MHGEELAHAALNGGDERVVLQLPARGPDGVGRDAVGQGVRHLVQGALLALVQQPALQPAQVDDVADAVDHAAQLLDREVAVVLALRLVEQFVGDHGRQAHGLLRLDPFEQALALVDGLERHAAAQIEAVKQRVDLVQVVGVDSLARAVFLECGKVAHRFFDFSPRVGRSLGGVAVDELVALGDSGLDQVALGGGRSGLLGRPHLGPAEPARSQVADALTPHGLAREVPRRSRQDASGAGRLGQGVGLRGHELEPRLVVDRLVGRTVDAALIGQIPVALQHALVRKPGGFLARVWGVEQGLDQLMPGGEAEHLRDDVRVDALLGEHAVLAEAQLGEVLKLGRKVGVQRLDALQIQFGRAFDLLAVDQAALQEGARPVDRLGHNLVEHLAADGLALLLGLTLQTGDGTIPRPREPLHVAQGPGLQRLGRGLRRLRAQLLVGLPLLLGHARLLGGLEQRSVALGLLVQGDLVARRQHAVEHAAHLGRQLYVQGRELLVDGQEPGTEFLEGSAQPRGRRFALEEIGLEAARPALVAVAALVQRQTQPDVGGHTLEAHELRRLGPVGRQRGVAALGHVGEGFEEEMPGLVQERRQVGVLEQGDRQRRRIEAAARSLVGGLLKSRHRHSRPIEHNVIVRSVAGPAAKAVRVPDAGDARIEKRERRRLRVAPNRRFRQRPAGRGVRVLGRVVRRVGQLLAEQIIDGLPGEALAQTDAAKVRARLVHGPRPWAVPCLFVDARPRHGGAGRVVQLSVVVDHHFDFVREDVGVKAVGGDYSLQGLCDDRSQRRVLNRWRRRRLV